jgi:hypothetical protein
MKMLKITKHDLFLQCFVDRGDRYGIFIKILFNRVLILNILHLLLVKMKLRLLIYDYKSKDMDDGV